MYRVVSPLIFFFNNRGPGLIKLVMVIPGVVGEKEGGNR